MARPKKEDGVEPVEKELTPEERALASRIANSGGWETIKEEDMVDYSLAEDPYKLPKEAAEKQRLREFAFRWAEAKPGRIDELQSLDPPARWWVCNSTNAPFLADYVDPAHGGVQRHDQILMIKPWRMHELHQAAKMKLAPTKDTPLDKLNGKDDDGIEWKSGQDYRIKGGDQEFTESGEFVSA